ncbi:MAG: fumarylacetoacetase [Planctomyces sp.]|nr:fumarylacetoacetase [Planctomyces sp.]MBA4039314.1 fumarylacetoacetase [Planctomyces sp.]
MPDTTPSAPAQDPTLNPALRSWHPPAQDPALGTPIQHLPLCLYIDPADSAGSQGHPTPHAPPGPPRPKPGVVIGDSVLDLDLLVHSGFTADLDQSTLQALHAVLHQTSLTFLMMHHELLPAVRRFAQAFLVDGPPPGQQARRLRTKALRPLAEVGLSVPARVGDFTDFYASIHHARTVGSMFRPDSPLLPNYQHVPIAYHGRSSSVVVSGTTIVRPRGQIRPEAPATTPPPSSPQPPSAPAHPAPVYAPTERLDYEAELGCLIGGVGPLGATVPIAQAHQRIFGLCLVNDWSARDIQAWEYQPLGPFLAKNFATSVSPWITTRPVLELFRVPGPARAPEDPAPLDYLTPAPPNADWALDIAIEALILTAQMRQRGLPPHPLATSNTRDLYWTLPQMIAHHTSGGCPLIPGDLIATGTVSGPGDSERGCLLELTWRGRGPDGSPRPRQPIALPSGEARLFLQDGDEVILRGWATPGRASGLPRLSLGEVRGVIAPAP